MFAPPVQAQTPPRARVDKGWSYPLYEGTEIKALLTGETAERVAGNEILLRQFRMRTFRNNDTNDVELIVASPECLFDPNTRIARSDGRLTVHTAATNYFIEGRGFLFHQTNMMLAISNEVHTTITSTNEQGEPNPPIEIFSDQFQFETHGEDEEKTSLAHYTGNVRVVDEELEVTSGELRVHLPSGEERPRRIVALREVVLTSQADGSRATGDEAIYETEEDQETVRLIGTPTWRDETRESTAEAFVLNRDTRVVHALGNAYLKSPQEGMGRPMVLAAEEVEADEPGFVEIFAERLQIQLPEAGEPLREMIAEENVVILGDNGASRATAQRAVYSEEEGTLELTGDPRWRTKNGDVEGDLLIAGGPNQAFIARQNVYLKLPAQGFVEAPAQDGDPDSERFIEIFADALDHETGLAVFRGNVRVRQLEDDEAHTNLKSDRLTIHLTDAGEIETLFAEDNVEFWQRELEAASDDSGQNQIQKNLVCRTLTLHRWPESGLLKSIHAEHDVFMERIESMPGRYLHKTLAAAVVNVFYAAGASQVERIVAEGDAAAEETEQTGADEKLRGATGRRIVYTWTPEDERVEVTGDPIAWTAGAVINDADILFWDSRSGKIRGRGPVRITPVSNTARAPGS